MIIYHSTKDGFLQDNFDQLLVDKIFSGMIDLARNHVSESERRSWENSLRFMSDILQDQEIPHNSGVAIEYKIPYTSKRVDFILTGKDENRNATALVVELKQWEGVLPSDGKQDVVKTYLGGGLREVTHPSYQAWSYVQFIKDYNESVQEQQVILQPCAYLHNYRPCRPDPLFDRNHHNFIDAAPLFVYQEARKLRDFIKKFVKEGDDQETIFLIENGRMKPSKSLQDSLASMLSGNQEFVMIDEQKTVFETALKMANDSYRDRRKRVLIVEGGPGTGKSVVVINLLVKFTRRGLTSQYVSKSVFPRKVYSARLKGTVKGSNIDNLFRGSSAFCHVQENVFNTLIVDEAHRLVEKSLYEKMGENQIKEIIRATNFSVFFIDEDQRISTADIGEVEAIERFAKREKAELVKMELPSQFRCDGSQGYVAWLDNILEIRDTANESLDFDYDFQVFDDPNELRAAIEAKNAENNRSRMVAGYCWEWPKEGRNHTDKHDIVIPDKDFSISWNLGNTDTWAIDPHSVNEAGCIHTCQGLEFDYVGVIIGDDLRYEDGRIITDFYKRAKTDQSIKGLKKMMKEDPEKASKLAEMIIKNTYRTLMTRGQKGCYVYCVDEGFANHLMNLSLPKSR